MNMGPTVMKRLYLVRHAKSSWDDHSLPDFERPLNKRGFRDAPSMGKYLAENGHIPELMISSPALRSVSTAEIFAKEMGYSRDKILKDENIYEADVSDLIELVSGLGDKYSSVMLFGHNPGFSFFAAFLLPNHAESLSTCAILCIDFDVSSWKEISAESGKKVFSAYPKEI